MVSSVACSLTPELYFQQGRLKHQMLHLKPSQRSFWVEIESNEMWERSLGPIAEPPHFFTCLKKIRITHWFEIKWWGLSLQGLLTWKDTDKLLTAVTVRKHTNYSISQVSQPAKHLTLLYSANILNQKTVKLSFKSTNTTTNCSSDSYWCVMYCNSRDAQGTNRYCSRRSDLQALFKLDQHYNYRK